MQPQEERRGEKCSEKKDKQVCDKRKRGQKQTGKGKRNWDYGTEMAAEREIMRQLDSKKESEMKCVCV